MINIRLANKKDCQQVAKIHLQEIKWGFLSRLGEKFLCYFYQALIDSPSGFLIIAQENDSFVGFISGSTDLKKFYKIFSRKYFFKILPLLFRKLFSVNILKKIYETRKYSKEENDLPKAELISIALHSQFQGIGISAQLLDEFFLEMKKRKIRTIKVIVGENLVQANKFYQKNGFKFHSKSFVHKDMPSIIYIYNIN